MLCAQYASEEQYSTLYFPPFDKVFRNSTRLAVFRLHSKQDNDSKFDYTLMFF